MKCICLLNNHLLYGNTIPTGTEIELSGAAAQIVWEHYTYGDRKRNVLNSFGLSNSAGTDKVRGQRSNFPGPQRRSYGNSIPTGTEIELSGAAAQIVWEHYSYGDRD